MDICLLAYELGASASDTTTTAASPGAGDASARPTFIVTFDPEQAALGALRRALNSWAPIWTAPGAQDGPTARISAGLPPVTTEEAALN